MSSEELNKQINFISNLVHSRSKSILIEGHVRIGFFNWKTIYYRVSITNINANELSVSMAISNKRIRVKQLQTLIIDSSKISPAYSDVIAELEYMLRDHPLGSKYFSKLYAAIIGRLYEEVRDEYYRNRDRIPFS